MSQREELSRDLSAYLDGELPASRAKRIEEVLVYDRDLADELRRLKSTRALLREMPLAQPPADFARHVLARSERARLLGRGPTGSYTSFRWISMATAAVVLIAAGLGWLLIMEQPPLATGPQADVRGQLARDGYGGPDQGGGFADAPPTGGPPTSLAGGEEKSDTGETPDAVAARPKAPEARFKGLEKKAGPPPADQPAIEEGFAALDEELKRIAIEAGNARVPAGGQAVDTVGKGGSAPADAEGLYSKTPGGRIGGADAPTAPDGKASGVGDTTAKRSGDKDAAPCVVIYTANLSFAQRDVEDALLRNGVSRRVTGRKAAAKSKADLSANYFRASEVKVQQVTYEAYVNESQLRDVRKALEAVRSQQAVSQTPAPELDTASQIAGKARHRAESGASKAEGIAPNAERADDAHKAQAAQKPAPVAEPSEQIAPLAAVIRKEVTAAEKENPLAQSLAITPSQGQGDRSDGLLRMVITLNLRTAPGEAQYQAARRAAATQAASQEVPAAHMKLQEPAPCPAGQQKTTPAHGN